MDWRRTAVPALGALTVLLVALACSGTPEPPAPSEHTVEVVSLPLPAPFDVLGEPPSPWSAPDSVETPWNRTAPNGLWVSYRHRPDGTPTPDDALDAWAAQAIATGWTEQRRSSIAGDPSIVLGRLGERLSMRAWSNGSWVNVSMDYEELEVVQSDWPTDPSCPEGTRRRPGEEARSCYLVDSELVRHGPYEEREDGVVIVEGQHDNGERVGVWRHDEGDFERLVDHDNTTVRWNIEGVLRAERLPDTWVFYDEAGEESERFPLEEDWPEGFTRADRTDVITQFGREQLEVLDIDPSTGTVAVRLQTPWYRDSSPADCEYAGLEDRYVGIHLALLDLGANTTEVFEVYPLASDPSECLTHAQSLEVLDSAKARFAEVGLDVTAKPTPTAPDGTSLTLAGHTLTLDISRGHGTAHPTDIYAMIFGSHEMRGHLVVDWDIDGSPGRPFATTYGRSMGGGAAAELMGGWTEDESSIALVRIDHMPLQSSWHFLRVP